MDAPGQLDGPDGRLVHSGNAPIGAAAEVNFRAGKAIIPDGLSRTGAIALDGQFTQGSSIVNSPRLATG
jgi:hypothetical protein